MIATYTINPNEMNDFFKFFEKTYGEFAVRITVEHVEPFPVETQEETNARILRSHEAAERGEWVHRMTMDELEAMVQ